MNISTIMSIDVETCCLNDTVETAAAKMWTRDIGCLPVVNEDSQVLGMVTDRDICMAAYLQGKPLREISVSNVMTGDVFCCGPNDNVTQAEDTMRAHKVHRLPVIDSEGKIVGIVSLNDLAREAERQVGTKQPDISCQEITGTLAAVSEPRGEQVLMGTI